MCCVSTSLIIWLFTSMFLCIREKKDFWFKEIKTVGNCCQKKNNISLTLWSYEGSNFLFPGTILRFPNWASCFAELFKPNLFILLICRFGLVCEQSKFSGSWWEHVRHRVNISDIFLPKNRNKTLWVSLIRKLQPERQTTTVCPQNQKKTWREPDPKREKKCWGATKTATNLHQPARSEIL